MHYWENRRITPAFVADHDGKLPSYAWPGGCPQYYLHIDACEYAEVLCPDCAQKIWEQRDEENALYFDTNWEDPELYCDECGKRIESAYAEED